MVVDSLMKNFPIFAKTFYKQTPSKKTVFLGPSLTSGSAIRKGDLYNIQQHTVNHLGEYAEYNIIYNYDVQIT